MPKQNKRLTRKEKEQKFSSVREWLESKRKEEAQKLDNEFKGEED